MTVRNRKTLLLIPGLLAMLFLRPLPASDEVAEQIEVGGLLGEKAVLIVDGTRHLVAVGETTPEGIELVAMEADGVRLKIDGEVRHVPLGGGPVRTRFSRRETIRERIHRDESGMYSTAGSINGMPVEFLIDTGASAVAMNTRHAKRLGIDYENGRPVSVQSASEVSRAWQVVLDEVGVGQIKVRNVDAVVMEKSGYPNILLGMSFLERMDIERRGRVMVLEY